MTAQGSQLLISVRSAAEAASILGEPVGLIDIKDPFRGPLGRASDATINAVLDVVNHRVPVSAALGELIDFTNIDGLPLDRLAYVKLGLSRLGDHEDWRDRLLAVRNDIERHGTCRLVAVAYADWRRAGAPSPANVAALATSRHFGAFLIDTWGKDGSTLRDWMRLEEIEGWCRHFRAAGIPLALSGALTVEDIRDMVGLQPAWFAVRGGACGDGDRKHDIEPARVRTLVAALHSP